MVNVPTGPDAINTVKTPIDAPEVPQKPQQEIARQVQQLFEQFQARRDAHKGSSGKTSTRGMRQDI